MDKKITVNNLTEDDLRKVYDKVLEGIPEVKNNGQSRELTVFSENVVRILFYEINEKGWVEALHGNKEIKFIKE